MFEWLTSLLSKSDYSNYRNKQAFDKELSNLQKNHETYRDLLIENIISHRGNLLTLAGGLIAFIGFFTQGGSISHTSPLLLKIAIISFIISIFLIIIVSIGFQMYDVKLIEYKINLINKIQNQTSGNITKINQINFGKNDVDNYQDIIQILNNNMKNGYRQSIAKKIGGRIGIILSLSLLAGMSTLAIYYFNLMF